MTTIHAKMTDGSSVVIEHTDLGDTVPAFDANGKSYEAYTSRFRIDGKELYVQLDKAAIGPSENVLQRRETEDMAHLVAIGVDIETVEFVD